MASIPPADLSLGTSGPAQMNLLKRVETTLANLVEGTFGRMFRAEVRPIELARKLAREMDQHRTATVSRVYAPSEYAVWLSPEDRGRYEGVEHEVIDELCAYLLEHARRENLVLASHPLVVFHTDERLALGEFGIQARQVRAAGDGEERDGPKDEQEHGQTMIYSTSDRVRGAVAEVKSRHQAATALLVTGGRRLLLPATGGTVGRSRDCDVVLEDVGISRRHAEIRPGPDGWTLHDLGSTNGVLVNGRRVADAQRLHSGDRVELGSTELVFELA